MNPEAQNIMRQYQAEISGNLVKPEIQKYFESFYEISDTPDAHQKYSEQFTKNAKLIMASNEANGRDGTPYWVGRANRSSAAF